MAHHESTCTGQTLHLPPSLENLLQPETIAVDSHGEILSASLQANKILKLGTSKKLPATLQQLVQKAVSTKQQVVAAELQIQTGIVPASKFHVTVQPLAIPGGDVFTVTITNVTGLAHLRESIERLDRLATLGTLTASMAHEIKNALVAVKTFIDLLLEKNKDAELAEIVGREMSRVNNIVHQILKFGSSAPPTRSPVRLHDVLEHSLRMVQPQLDGKLISTNCAFNAVSDSVHGDNHQLEQVFVNLFLNAVDATGANGSLTVKTEFISVTPPNAASPQCAGQPHVRVTVADTGAGIAPENLDRLFEPFFTTKSNGTGLGLPITRRIIHEHDGLITVESKPNCGTTFSIILPAGPQAI